MTCTWLHQRTGDIYIYKKEGKVFILDRNRTWFVFLEGLLVSRRGDIRWIIIKGFVFMWPAIFNSNINLSSIQFYFFFPSLKTWDQRERESNFSEVSLIPNKTQWFQFLYDFYPSTSSFKICQLNWLQDSEIDRARMAL